MGAAGSGQAPEARAAAKDGGRWEPQARRVLSYTMRLGRCYRAVVTECALIIRACAPEGAGIITECAPAPGAVITPSRLAYRAVTHSDRRHRLIVANRRSLATLMQQQAQRSAL